MTKSNRLLFVLVALALVAVPSLIQQPVVQAAETVLIQETFDNANNFTTSTSFFSDGDFDYFGIADGAGGGDFGADSVPSGLKNYTGFTGSFLTGMDLDGEGAQLPVTVTWTGIDVSGQTNLGFRGDFAEFFDDPGDIDSDDVFLLEYQIDGGGYQPLIAFEGSNYSSTSGPFNGVFRLDTPNFGPALTGEATTIGAAIPGTGNALDLRLTVSVDAGDEDFAVDNFTVVSDFEADSTPPTIVSLSPADNATDVPTTTNQMTLTFNEPIAEGSESFLLYEAGNPTPVFDATVDGDNYNDFGNTLTVTLTNFTFQPETAYYVEMAANAVRDAAGNGFGGISGTDSWNFSTAGAQQACTGGTVTLISAVQGSGASTPLNGQTVTVEGIVIGDYQDTIGDDGDLNGFYVQEERADSDGNPATSEGIFVFDGSSQPSVDVKKDDVVRVTGTAGEFNDQTQLSGVTVELCGTTGNIRPTLLNFPLPDKERFEGMLVGTAQTLVVTEFFQLGRFGQMLLAYDGNGPDDRIGNFTQYFQPNAGNYSTFLADKESRTIFLDDGRTTQNPANIPYPSGGLAPNNPIRGGDSISGFGGVMGYSFGAYRIQYVDGAPYNFTNVVPRPNNAPVVNGNMTVVATNVLNYFETIDTGADICGPGGNLGCRGADTADEFDRQRTKIINALIEMDADVYGLVELENDTDNTAINDLVDGLNNVAGAGTYAAIQTGAIGTDAIRVGFIYKPGMVSPLGNYAVLDTAAFTNPNGYATPKNRPALAQTFEVTASNSPDFGETFTAVVLHMKSKGCSDAAGADLAQGDGQGCYNDTRTKGIQQLINWLDGNPTSAPDFDYIVMGDINAYFNENPIDALVNDGFINLFPNTSYSYVFDGEWGALDYAFVSQSMSDQVVDRAKWNINADEPSAFDYNDFNQSGFYVPAPFRYSDHDPVIVGLDLDVTPPEITGTDPLNGAVDVPIESNVSVTLNERIQRPERAGIRFVCQPGNVPILGRLSVSGRTYTLNPAENLPFDSTCTLSIPLSNIQDTSGNELADTDGNDANDGRYTLVFETEQFTPPRIINTTPSNGDGNVDVGTNVSVTFSEKVNVVELRGIRFVCDPGGAIRGGLSVSGNTYTLNPREDLPFDAACVLSIPVDNFEDADGNILVDNDGDNDGVLRLRFRTESEPVIAPEIISTSPTNGATGVALTGPVSVTMSEPTTVVTRRGIRFGCEPGDIGRLQLSRSGNSYVLNTPDGLPANASCTLSIPIENIEDADGNTLVDNDSNPTDGVYTLSFETGDDGPILLESAEAEEAESLEMESITIDEAPAEAEEPETMDEITIDTE